MDRGAWQATVHRVAKELDATEHSTAGECSSLITTRRDFTGWQRDIHFILQMRLLTGKVTCSRSHSKSVEK